MLGSRVAIRFAALLAVALVGASGTGARPVGFVCPRVDAACASACDAAPPATLYTVGADELPSPGPTIDVRLRARLVVTTAWPDGPLAFDRAAARAYLARIVQTTDDALAPCGVGLDLDRAEVLAVPARLLTIDGNAPDAWGGLAPPGVDADAFNYARGDRLPALVRELFDRARDGASRSAIAIVVVDDVYYHAAGKRTRAGGLSFPPLVYHHPDDFPLRNGVLVGTGYLRCGELPIALHPRVVAHELGHMLLDTAHHDADDANVMSPMLGPGLRPEQCARIRAAATTTYGPEPVVDPRAPRG